MVNHAACLKRPTGSEGRLALLPWRELPMFGGNWLPHRRDRTRDYPSRVVGYRRLLEVNPPDPETQSTANLLSAAMGQD